MKNKKRWANIICNQALEPYMMIVTDGDFTSEIPLKNTKLKTAKKAALDVYDVPPGQILVSQVFDGKSNAESEE